MTTERDGNSDGDHASRRTSGDRFDEALRDAVEENDATSCEDADASAFLERFPTAAREPQRPKTD